MADLLGIELARPGTWHLASGPLHVTPQMLADAAKYAARTGARPSPVKLGHSDPRFTGDGEPALGWLANLRVQGEGDAAVLLGDITGMPEWLAAAAPAHWPDRSVEGWQDYEVDGETYSFVIDGLALLGVTPPGMSTIRSLRDLPQALGVAASARIVARMGAPDSPASEAEVPPNTEGAGMDPAKIREALGLSATASDEEVKAAWASSPLAVQPNPPADPPSDPDPEPAPNPTQPKPELVNAAGVVHLSASVWEETQNTIKNLQSFVDRTQRDERDQVIAKAVEEGKFTPAQRPHFAKLWDADPKGTRALIDSLTRNTISVTAMGYSGDGADEDFNREYAGLFPPTYTNKGA